MTNDLWENLKNNLHGDLKREEVHRSHYQKLFREHVLGEGLLDGNLSEKVSSDTSVADRIRDGDWVQDDQLNQLPAKFHKSIMQSKRKEFLTDYSVNDFAHMKLFLVNGANAGFALKPDGDIVAVHNNTGQSGIGNELIKAAVKNGGTKLDHFDGFLHGFYSKLGFKVSSRDLWNDKYAPQGWNYIPIDVFNPEVSSYAKDLQPYRNDFRDDIVNNFETVKKSIIAKFVPSNFPHELYRVLENYRVGKPSIIYQTI